MKLIAFAKRCTKEILRDPLTLLFGLGFPLVILLLLSAIQSNIPVDLFNIENLAPGIVVFGLSFMTLFSATLLAKDKESSLLERLFTTPLKSSDYILGYMLPIIPISILQSLICYIVSIFLGLTIKIDILYALLMVIPISIFYTSLGLLCGSLLNVKQVGGICGALLTNLSAWFSGVWFDLNLVGGFFAKISNFLPFVHFVELQRAIINQTFIEALPHLYIVLIYALVTLIAAILVFLIKRKRY